MENLELIFNRNLETIKEYFIKYSFKEKLKFLINLIEKSKNAYFIFNILQTLFDKIAVYTLSNPDPAYINNKLLNDHNRVIPEENLLVQQEEFIKCFELLREEHQIIVITELISKSGGNIIGKLFLEINKLPKYEEFVINFENKCDSGVATLPEVKKFNNIISKYKKKVEKEAGVKVAKNVTKKSKKTNKKPKENSKTSKTSASTKGKKSSQEADFIQLLPVWIIKRIFNYLDDKTLSQIKQINEYWSYIVDDLKNDKKTRKILNNKLVKLTENIELESTITPKYTRSERRLIKLLERGTVSEKMNK